MKAKKCILAGFLAAAMLCESLFGHAPAGLLQAYAAEAANVSLNKPVTVSGLEQEGSYTGDMAVDGQNDGNSRWSGGYMKGNHTTADQWLIIDLEAEETLVTSIEVAFHLKVWATKYRIETSDSADGGWSTIKTVERAAASTENLTDTFLASDLSGSTLKRYVRFYFTELNSQAGGDAISVREITIMGTQSGVAESASGVLNQITALTVGPEDRTLSIPAVSSDYDIKVYGSEVDCLVSESKENNGKVSPLRIGDRSFQLILQATNKTNPADTAKKSNVTVTVQDNTAQYPDLFPQVEHPNPVPKVLPTLQEWYGYEGNFTLRADSKIIVNDKANVGLSDVAKEMQEDLKEICGKTFEIVADGSRPKAADIYLESLTEDIYGTGEEGYLIKNGDNGIEIYSAAKTGALYGTVTVEQILYQDEAHENVPKGVIRDYPLYGTRGIMFDVARIPTRMQFLHDYAKILKWYKLNTMQLHLNDNQWSDPAYSPDPALWQEVEASHRLESELFPSLAKQRSKFMKPGDNEGRYDYYFSTHTGSTEEGGGELYYTKDEYRELEAAARGKGVEIVAELDTPGHSAAYNKYVYNNQQEVITSLVNHGYLDRDTYLNADGTVKKNFYTNNLASNGTTGNFELLSIDESSADAMVSENARNAKIFMTALFDEYLGGIEGIDPVFTTDTISAGVDEYWQKTAATKTAFGVYMNYMYDLLGESDEGVRYGKNETGYGKDVIMWGAMNEFPVSDVVNKNITLAIWSMGEDNAIARMQDGFSIINIPQPFLYTTPGRHHKDMVNEVYVYYNWDPTRFNASVCADKGEPLLKGAMAALWGDENREGITEADLNERYLRLAAMVGEKNWGGTKQEDTFLSYEQTFDRLREGPGTQIAYQNESRTNIVLDYDFNNLAEDGTLYDASGNGYHGTVTGGEVVTDGTEAMLRFDGNTKIETPLTSLTYPYTVSFDVLLDAADQTKNNKESALFSGYDGRLQVAGLNGQLGLNRDYFTQSFGYEVESGTKHRITVVGTYQATKLYVDGVFQKILYAAGSDPDNGGQIGKSTWRDADNNFRTTFVFPLNVIGANFSGRMGNIRAYKRALSTEELAAEGQESGEVDVARNRGAYSDNHNSAFYTDGIRLFPAWKATDGDGHVTGTQEVSTSYESRWSSSDYDADFLMVDLGRVRKLSKTVIDWEKDRYAAAYKIMVSLDGTQWQEVSSVTGNTNKLTTDTFRNTAEARYVKMQGVTRKSGANEYAIHEIKVYETVNKGELAEAITAAEALLAEEGIGWDAAGAKSRLHESVVTAKAVYADVMAGQEEADEAKTALNRAVADWKEGITEIVYEYEPTLTEILSMQSSYTQASWQAFWAAYERAVDASNELSNQERVELLNSAANGLKTLFTPQQQEQMKNALLNADEIFAKKDEYDTEKASWKTLEKAYNDAKNADADLSSEEYGTLLQALLQAVGSVEKKKSASAQLLAPSVTGVKSEPTQVSVTWNAVPNAAAYQLMRTIGGVSVKVGDAVTQTTAYDKDPEGGKEMSYSVIALAGNQAAYTDSAAGSAMSITLPSATKKVTAVQAKGKKAVTVKWKKVKGASSYLIYRADGKKAFKKIASVSKKKVTYYDKKKIKKGKTYSYKVVAVSGKSYSPMKAAKKAVKIK